jgi:hypothetical protein
MTYYLKYIFHVKTQLSLADKVCMDPHLAPWIWIRIEVKSWIRILIRIETSADPQHWSNLGTLLKMGAADWRGESRNSMVGLSYKWARLLKQISPRLLLMLNISLSRRVY